MTYATNFEKYAIRVLCGSYISKELLSKLLESEASDFKYSGSGYFLYFKHKDLPKNRIVCDDPKLKGEWNGIESGFLVFLENHELMLECHTWGEVDVPQDYREKSVSVSQIEI